MRLKAMVSNLAMTGSLESGLPQLQHEPCQPASVRGKRVPPCGRAPNGGAPTCPIPDDCVRCRTASGPRLAEGQAIAFIVEIDLAGAPARPRRVAPAAVRAA